MKSFALAIAVAMLGGQAAAQATTTNNVDNKVDWSVFEETNPKECMAVSAPTEVVNSDANGQPKTVNRGEIRLIVFYRPSANATGQVAFTGGYPFAPGSNVRMTVGDRSFDLFTEGEWAWPTSPQEDARVVAALKAGATAVLQARSARGTRTSDTFSLSGFTAAVEDAAKRCQ